MKDSTKKVMVKIGETCIDILKKEYPMMESLALDNTKIIDNKIKLVYRIENHGGMVFYKSIFLSLDTTGKIITLDCKGLLV